MDTYDKWLTIDELAGYIKMSRTKLYGMAQRGEIPASKIGTQWRFDREEIDQLQLARMWDKRQRGYRAMGYEIKPMEAVILGNGQVLK